MSRKPVATIVTNEGAKDGEMVLVVCDDGSVFELGSDREHVGDGNEFGYFWYHLPPIPGTDEDIERR